MEQRLGRHFQHKNYKSDSRRYAALHSSENARILSASAGFRFENEEPGKGDAESPWKW